MTPAALKVIRARSTKTLHKAGFRFATNIPVRTPDICRLRPIPEIVSRLAALKAVVWHVTEPEDRTPEKEVRSFAAKFDLVKHLAPQERSIWKLTRKSAYKKHVQTIGWYMENMLPLAWALGCRIAPRIDGEMLGGAEQIEAIDDFLPIGRGYATFEKKAKLRPLAKIVEMEDLFYCAHNAARCAVFSDPRCVPRDFDPIAGGGVTHERRHALTWMLSPGTAWEHTDLST